MKRVKAACICQTLYFQLKEDIAHDSAITLAGKEVAQYKKNLEQTHTQHKIVEEAEQAGVMAMVTKQYNSSPIEDDLNKISSNKSSV